LSAVIPYIVSFYNLRIIFKIIDLNLIKSALEFHIYFLYSFHASGSAVTSFKSDKKYHQTLFKGTKLRIFKIILSFI